MTRFLFAILRQKNLKDIDWNKVARDPILAQEITNGHAARMRYSRFRSAMLGLEPQRRNRTNPNKSKVTKSSKKDSKAKKDDSVKPEASMETASIPESSQQPPPNIKQETLQPSYDNRLTPGPQMSPAQQPTSSPHAIQPRLLTPCSDTDAYAPSPVITSSPASDMINSQTSFEFPAPPRYTHDHRAWQQPVMFPFSAPSFGFNDFDMCNHQPMFTHTENFGASDHVGEVEGEYGNVKHEEWHNQC